MKQTDTYNQVYEVLAEQYQQIEGLDFYKYIFPNNENTGEDNQDFSKPNAIYLYHEDGSEKLRRRIMLNDTWEDDYKTYVENNPMTLCGGLSYRKRTNKIVNAQRMHALIFDLDGVGYNEIRTLLFRLGKENSEVWRALPIPTFIALSGTGLHLYYVFDEPIDLYPFIKMQLKSLKYDITFRLWDWEGTSQEKTVQYSSINQGFRMIGSINNKYGNKIIAFKTGERVTIDYLNQYLNDEKNKVDLEMRYRPSKMTKAEAKEKYPEWYQRVVIDKERSLKKWDIKSKQGYALYEWWKKRRAEVLGGHRYYYLMCMAIYACKCDVPKKQLKEDMQVMFEYLKKEVSHDNPLTQDDVNSALEAYDKEYYNFKIEDIEKLSNIRIDRAKRNGRPQLDHIKMMNYIREEINNNKDWRNKDGQPKKQEMVSLWRKENPTGTKADCNRETGLDPKTIRKWWEEVMEREYEKEPYVFEGDNVAELMALADKGIRSIKVLDDEAIADGYMDFLIKKKDTK